MVTTRTQRKWIQRAVLGCVLLVFLALPAWGSNHGKRLYQAKGCASCHGQAGAKPVAGLTPKLAGQNAAYLVDQLKAFKALQREGAGAQAMWTFAQSLSASEMLAIADYLARQK